MAARLASTCSSDRMAVPVCSGSFLCIKGSDNLRKITVFPTQGSSKV